ncbi:hypothetical protein BC834DRAFT_973489 [Gloeopeniophorella convolvens]|nr:hypothetical protein BC834DRAFT_973489 [Gloeopeniophorella convolvens]
MKTLHLIMSSLAFAALAAALAEPGRRQDPSPEVAPQCQSACAVLDTLQDCTTVACGCSQNTMNEVYACVQCGVSLVPSTAAAQGAQETLSDLAESCSAAGVSLTVPTVTAGPGAPSTPSTADLPTPSGDGSATIPGAGTPADGSGAAPAKPTAGGGGGKPPGSTGGAMRVGGSGAGVGGAILVALVLRALV